MPPSTAGKMPAATQALPLFGREAPAQAVLRDDSRHKEVLQILASAGFGAAAGHLEAAEGLTLDNRAR